MQAVRLRVVERQAERQSRRLARPVTPGLTPGTTALQPVELWDRIVADLNEIEKRTGGRDKSPATAIVNSCLDARRATAGKDKQ